MDQYEIVCKKLIKEPKTWLVTGVAGFIGSNLLETLLNLNQKVVGLDNFSTGHKKNLIDVRKNVSDKHWNNFKFINGDICNYDMCKNAVNGVNYVLHQAALGSVPRSIDDPIKSNASNIDGFLNILNAARLENVDSFTYAASSSTYGDHKALPKKEDIIGKPLSPYAVTKYVNELYAGVFSDTYKFKSIGLRYFNVFGKRQDPNGPYAAVIPKWINSIIANKEIIINGDGQTSRDFCYIDNTVQMNILAATANEEAKNNVYNVALGDRTTLTDLLDTISNHLYIEIGRKANFKHKEFRKGDVRHSQASIEKSISLLKYSPKYKIEEGLKETIKWYLKN